MATISVVYLELVMLILNLSNNISIILMGSPNPSKKIKNEINQQINNLS